MFAFTVEFSPCYILGLGFISILIFPIRKQIQPSFITCLCSHVTEWQRLDWFPGLSNSKVSFFLKHYLEVANSKFSGRQTGNRNEQTWVESKATGVGVTANCKALASFTKGSCPSCQEDTGMCAYVCGGGVCV